MLLTTRVKVVLTERPTIGLPNVKVSLYDRDIQGEDDLLGTQVTDEKGEILFSYDSSLYTDAEDQPEWSVHSLPDLYVIVYGANGQVVLNTRPNALQDQLPKLITVPIERRLAEQHGLVPP